MEKIYPVALSILFLISGSITSAQRVTDDLVAYFPFSEGSGDYMADQSGYGEPLLLKRTFGTCEWPSDGGVRFSSPGLIKSLSNANKIAEACGSTQEITLEVWVKAEQTTQDGPARIMSSGFGTSNRNYMLGQQGDKFLARLRTTSGSLNGTPNLETPAGMTGTAVHHVVYTRSSAGNEYLYIDGSVVTVSTRTGNFSNWNPNYELAFFNELDASRPWLGTIYLAAIYSTALSQDEVMQNFNAGAHQAGGTMSETMCSTLDCFVDGYGSSQRSLWLNGLPFPTGADYAFAPGGGGFDVYEDGTAHLYGMTWNVQNPAYGWYLDLWLTDAMSWNEWSSLGRSWKGDPALVGDLFTTWTYYIVDPSAINVLIGLGAFEGSTLTLAHRPSDYEFGFQYGTGANDKNLMPGMSVWLDVEGQVNGQSIDIVGDLNLEGECTGVPALQCPADIEVSCETGYEPELTGWPEVECEGDYSLTYSDAWISGPCPEVIERTWSVEYSDGNVAVCSQEVMVVDTVAPVIDPLVFLEEGCTLSELIAAVVTDQCDPEPTVTFSISDSTWVSPEPCEPGMYRTQTQGGWGSVPNGNNPGAWLHQHFDEVFPNGITIGCNNSLTLSTAQAVTDFLPSGSTPSALPAGALLNPGGSYSNVLAGQLVAATISVAMDAVISDFGSGDIPMGELQIASGTFQGWTISALLAEANAAIGGCGSSFSLPQLNEALSSLNENFVDGTTNEGFIDCSVPFDCYLLLSASITATDDCGNIETWQGGIIVADTTALSFEGWPVEIHVSCDSIPDLELPEECFEGLTTFTVNETLFSGGCLPAIQRVYSAADACGNSASFTQYIFVHDHVAPVFAEEPQDIAVSCWSDVPEFTPVATDNCDPEPEISLTELITGDGCTYTILRTWTATDHCGNTSVIDQLISVSDDEAPLINGQASASWSCLAGEIPQPTVSDNCDSTPFLEMTESIEYAGCAQMITRTWTATDACGNASVWVQLIEVNDTEPPVFAFVPAGVSLSCGSALPDVDAIATDNCSDVQLTLQVTESEVPGECSQVTRTWIATDACGNSAIASQVIHFVDEQAPVLSGVPADATGSCGEIAVLPSVTAMDNCDGEVDVELSETFVQSNCGITIYRIWSATDGCGNTSIAAQTLTLSDTEAPVITGQSFISVSCLQDTWIPPTATDDCSEVSLVYSDVMSGGGCDFMITREWLATDACGNVSTFMQVIQVTDDVAPVFTAIPADVSLSCGDLTWYESPVVLDNCDETPMVEMVETTDVNACETIITRTWIATDDCGNSAQASQVIAISDNEPPMLSGIPADITLDCSNTALPEVAQVTASDDCNQAVITFEETTLPGSCVQEWIVVRTWTATDECGNQSEGVQYITITDNTPPTFDVVPEDVWVDCGNVPEPGTISASDACDPEVIITMEEESASGGCPLIHRIWTATDDCGNSAQYVQAIHIVDNEPPVLSGIPPVLEASCNNIGPLPEPQVADNCDDNVAVTFTQSTIGSGCEFMIVRTWIAEDDCGNSSVISQSVLVTDTEPPVFVNALPEITVNCTQLETLSYPTVTDDCGNSVMITYVDTPLGSGCSYDVLRTYTAQDLCGNQASSTQLIHVTDATPPVLSGAPLNMNVSCSNIPQPPVVTGWDSCSGAVPVSFQESVIGGGCFYQILRIWSATDECGNTAFASQMLFVSDNVPPQISGVPANLVLGCNDMIPLPAQPAATDNCATGLVLNFQESQVTSACGTVITRTWATQDYCGNVASAVQVISLLDQAAPVFTYVPEDVTVSCDQLDQTGEAVAADDCSNVVMSYMDEVIPGGCPYTIVRTWIAMDACGHVSTAEQVISVYDPEAPVISGPVGNLALECGDDIPPAQATAWDNCQGDIPTVFNESYMEDGCTETIHRMWTATDHCGNTTTLEQFITITDTQSPVASAPVDLVVDCATVPVATELTVTDCHGYEIAFSELVSEGACATEYQIIRTWDVMDECGNASQYVQVIDVTDTIAPVFTTLPQDLVVDCNTIPEAEIMMAMDDCGNEALVSFEEVVNWTSENDTTCILSNTLSPAGEVVVLLPGFGGYSDTYIFDEAGGMMVEDPLTGTAHLTGYVYAPGNPEQAWYLDVYLREKRSWTEWSALGRSYKDDMQLAGDSYLDWSYFEMDESSKLIGAGIFEGSQLNLTHAPSDFYYGFQLGLAANNTNAEYGLSGWMFYEGEVNGVYYSGPGDIMTQNQCCPAHEIIRTWVATDCAGNSTTWTQTIVVDPLIGQPEPLALDMDGRNYLQVADGYRQHFVISFELFFGGQANLDMYSTSGQFLRRLYEGDTERGTRYTVTLDKSIYPTGMYHFVLSGDNGVISKRGMNIR